MAEWYYQTDDGEQGPIPAPELKNLAEKGIVVSDTLVRPENSPKWRKAGLVKNLVSSNEPASNDLDSKSSAKSKWIIDAVAIVALIGVNVGYRVITHHTGTWAEGDPPAEDVAEKINQHSQYKIHGVYRVSRGHYEGKSGDTRIVITVNVEETGRATIMFKTESKPGELYYGHRPSFGGTVRFNVDDNRVSSSGE